MREPPFGLLTGSGSGPKFYHAIGTPELGLLPVCSADFTMAEAYGGGEVERTRTQNIMQGASRCHFRYRRKADEKGEG
jgi:hypothetical protein